MTDNSMQSTGMQSESGVAMLWMIMVGVLVAIVVAGSFTSFMARKDAVTDAQSVVRAGTWSQAAFEDIGTRLDTFQIGPSVSAEDTTTKDQTVCVFDGCPVTPSGVTTTPLGDAVKLNRGAQTGYYQVLAPKAGAPAWTGLRIFDSTRPADQGTFSFVVRAWESASVPRPVTHRVVFRQASLARFSILSDEKLDMREMGSLTAAGRIHSNNMANRDPGIYIPGGPQASTESVSTREGRIVVSATSDCGSAKCVADSGDIISFNTATKAMLIARNRGSSICPSPGAFSICTFSSAGGVLGAGVNIGAGMPVTTMPMWKVNIGATSITVTRYPWAMRSDVGAVAAPDDRLGPNYQAVPMAPITVGVYTPATGGGVMLFDGDVVVTGYRPLGAPPITIMAERTTSFPNRTVGTVSVPTRQPASIYLEKSSGAIGASSVIRPVGLVAQGGVYTPSYAMSGINQNLLIRNVAIMAATESFSYGPAISSIADDPLNPAALSVSPASAAQMGYGQGNQLRFEGSIASAKFIRFRYGQVASPIGYKEREFSYVPSLAWNPPPLFPTDGKWTPVKAVPVAN